MRAKEWLLANGHIGSIGRGRISLENHKRLAESGEKFSDWPKGKVTEVTVRKDNVDTQVVRVVKDQNAEPGMSEYLFPDEYRFPEAEYKAVTVDGDTYGMREACNVCRLSLVNHKCDNPSVLGKPVRIVRR